YKNTVTLATSSTALSSAGSYTVVAHYTSNNSNYQSADSAALAFTISKATSKETRGDAGGTYNGSAFPASATVTGVPADGTLATSPSSTISFTYKNTVSLAISSTAPSSAGSYTVVAHYTSNNSNYQSADSAAVAFTIGKA